jgi:hypothetical protein
MRENAFSSKVLEALRDLHIGWFTKIVATRYAKSGVPDILGCIYVKKQYGQFVGIELKKPSILDAKSALTEVQELTIEEMIPYGAKVLVSSNLYEITRWAMNVYNGKT